ncbi:MAG: hypothetical protein QOG21_1255 [Actinomycetota bacterium]|nr:hypothetical protein [Actinomycetota bacterium]
MGWSLWHPIPPDLSRFRATSSASSREVERKWRFARLHAPTFVIRTATYGKSLSPQRRWPRGNVGDQRLGTILAPFRCEGPDAAFHFSIARRRASWRLGVTGSLEINSSDGSDIYHRCMANDAHEKSRALWDQMAPGWERTRDYMLKSTGHVSEWLVENMRPHQGDVILDLAGGPGDNGFLAAARVGPSGRVIETDFAPQMVEIARRRAAELGLQQVETRTLNAEKMDLGDDSVDGIICRWGFMLMLEPHSALEECRRVLKEGRRLALSVWAGPEKNPWVTITGMTMRELGYETAGDPFGPGGIFSMAQPGTVETMLRDSGFTDVAIEEMAVDWRHDSSDEAWDFMTQVAGPIAALVKELPADELETLRNALKKKVETFRTDTGITLPGVTITASAS